MKILNVPGRIANDTDKLEMERHGSMGKTEAGTVKSVFWLR
jgi:hypothetical protein